MRFADWTFREVRIREHSELRDALRLGRTPARTALYKVMRRLDDQALKTALTETVRSSLRLLRKKR